MLSFVGTMPDQSVRGEEVQNKKTRFFERFILEPDSCCPGSQKLHIDTHKCRLCDCRLGVCYCGIENSDMLPDI